MKKLWIIAALPLLLTACERPATPTKPTTSATPAPVRNEAPAKEEADRLPTPPDYVAIARAELLKNCDVIETSFSPKNKIVRYKLDAITNRGNDAKKVADAFSTTNLSRDFKSFTPEAINSISTYVAAAVDGKTELGVADRSDIACEVAARIHAYYIQHPDKAPTEDRTRYAALGKGGQTASPAPAARASAPARTEAPAATATTATTTTAAPATAYASSDELEDVKSAINRLYNDQQTLSTRIDAISRRGYDPTMWIWASLAGLLLLFIVFYRNHRRRTRVEMAKLQAELNALKITNRTDTEQLMENMIPIFMSRINSEGGNGLSEAEVRRIFDVEKGTLEREIQKGVQELFVRYGLTEDVVKRLTMVQSQGKSGLDQQDIQRIADDAIGVLIPQIAEAIRHEVRAQLQGGAPEATPTYTAPATTDTAWETEETEVVSAITFPVTEEQHSPSYSGGEYLFSGAPHGDLFYSRHFQPQFVSGETMYYITISETNPQAATFSLVEDAATRRIAFNLPNEYLSHAFELRGSGPISHANEVRVTEQGELVRDGANWRIAKRGVLVYV